MQFLNLFFLLVFQFRAVQNAEILIFAYHDTGSHFISMSSFFTRLANSGHHVTLFDTIFKEDRFHHPNITDLHVHIPAEIVDPSFVWESFLDSEMMLDAFTGEDSSVFGPLLSMYSKELDRLLEKKWDLVIADTLFIPHGHAIALRLLKEQGTPFMLYETACQLENWQMNMLGMGWNPITKPYMFSIPYPRPDQHYSPQRFFDRLETFANTYYESFGYFYLKIATYFPNVENFGVENFNYWQFLNHAEVTLAERIDRMGWMMPVGNDIVDIGASCPENMGRLPDDLKEFMEKPKSKGTIYVAFGTYANWSVAPANIIELFSYTFSKISSDYQIVLSYNGKREKMPKLANLKIVKWAPQSSVLQHPKTRLFISHGGLKSAKEAVCAKVPILAIPLYAEQPYTADSIVKQQIGRVLNKLRVKKTEMLEEINELLNNPRYAKNIHKFKLMFMDRPSRSLPLAEWYAERILRLKNGKKMHFKRRGARMSWVEYINLDVFGLFLLISILCI